MQTETLKIALWSINFRRKLSNLGDWLAIVEQQIANAKAGGAELLILPEYASEHWMAFAPTDLPVTEEIPWMATKSAGVLAVLRALAVEQNIAILAGTIPVSGDAGQYHNRAHFFTSEGAVIVQDKLSLTPNEQDENAWLLEPGTELNVFTWRGLNMAILTCLDIEMPALSILLAPHDIDLILVPSMTTRFAGYHRVFGCAKARAIELQAAIAVVGPIGNVMQGDVVRGDNTSASALYLPCEECLGHNGVAESVEVSQGHDPTDLIDELLFATVPCQQVRDLRQGLAEVWPGGWSAEHIKIKTIG